MTKASLVQWCPWICQDQTRSFNQHVPFLRTHLMQLTTKLTWQGEQENLQGNRYSRAASRTRCSSSGDSSGAGGSSFSSFSLLAKFFILVSFLLALRCESLNPFCFFFFITPPGNSWPPSSPIRGMKPCIRLRSRGGLVGGGSENLLPLPHRSLASEVLVLSSDVLAP